MKTIVQQPRLKNAKTLQMAGVLLGIGAALLLASGAYYTYGVFAKSSLSELTYSADRPSASGANEAGVAARTSSASNADGDASVSKGDPEPRSPAQAPYVDGQMRPDGEAAAVAEDIYPAEAFGAESQTAESAGHARANGPATGGGDATRAASQATVEGLANSVAQEDAEPARAGNLEAAELAPLPAEEGSPGDAAEPYEAGSGAATALLFQSPAPESSPAVIAPAAEIFLPAPDIPSVDTTGYSDPSSILATSDHLPATKITIPAVRVDSGVKDLDVVLLADSFAWETPKWVVGHIPSTAQPGDRGQGWYFGHLESPIRGEGNVFQSLPEIPELLANNETVHIVLETEGRKYLYQVYKTEVVHQDDLQITDSGSQDITLVTCVPRFYYDNRLLVTAALVGVSGS